MKDVATVKGARILRYSVGFRTEVVASESNREVCGGQVIIRAYARSPSVFRIYSASPRHVSCELGVVMEESTIASTPNLGRTVHAPAEMCCFCCGGGGIFSRGSAAE
jgi:hypothetical protein